MAAGPGKYDAEATAARESAKAGAVVLIVLDGDRGSGFSVQVLSPGVLERLPGLLRHMAADIEADVQRATPEVGEVGRCLMCGATWPGGGNICERCAEEG